MKIRLLKYTESQASSVHIQGYVGRKGRELSVIHLDILQEMMSVPRLLALREVKTVGGCCQANASFLFPPCKY